MKEILVNHQLIQAPRAANGQLLRGSRLNPAGRPPGSGIRSVFQTLFAFMAEPEVQRRIGDALRKEAEEHPYRFARQYILPLTPYKQRKALREQIRAAEQAAFEQAQTSFSGVSDTRQP